MIQQASTESQSKYPGRTVHLEGDTFIIHIPMKFRRRGGRKASSRPDGADANEPPQPKTNRPLLIALARAYKWQRMLDEGEVGSFDALATRCGVDRSYVGRTLRLAALAPDIVETILDGAAPSGLSLRRLNRDLPALWSEQCQAVGIQT